MAYSLNKAQIIGVLGDKPKISYTKNDNTPVANLSVGTSRMYKDKTTGEFKYTDETWHRVVAFGYLAEKADKLDKMSKVYVEGTILTRDWKNEETGKEGRVTEIRANELIALDKKMPDQTSDEKNSSSSETASKDDDFEDKLPF
jgi:single-strand DNA-binding protein